jgi:uncharacterized protein
VPGQPGDGTPGALEPMMSEIRFTMITALAAIGLMTPLAAAGQTAKPVTPSFDCAKATGQVEQLVCKDAGLASLDRKLADAYAKAMKGWPADVAKEQRVIQRGWVKGRDDCWKADDLRACVENEYNTRLVEVQIKGGLVMAPTPVAYRCTGAEGAPFKAAFYKDTDPPSAVLTVGTDQVIAFAARSGSGARYTAPNVEFWEHQGEATLDWFGKKLTCTLLR